MWRLLHEADLSWKKCKKLLGKRNAAKRAAFMARFHELYAEVARGDVLLLYIDESHFHRDLDLGYTWSRVGQRAWRISDCPSLQERINWYGAYNFSDGQCLIWNEGHCNSEHTAEFLQRVAEWVEPAGRRVVVIWDGAPWHRAKLVQQAAADLGIEILPLPGYSPDLNPIEGLWKWMREDVTQHECYPSLRELFDACKQFTEDINQSPVDLVNRLWPRFELDPRTRKTPVLSVTWVRHCAIRMQQKSKNFSQIRTTRNLTRSEAEEASVRSA